jgi:hypothetical protein
MSETEILDAPAKISQYDKIEAGLADLRSKYSGVVFDVSTNAGLDDAKKARAAVREPRYELEKVRKALKAPALEYAKRIDTEAKRIEGELLKIEQPLDETIKAEEARREEVKRAKEEAERQRQEAIQKRINALAHYPVQAVGGSAADIADMRAIAAELPITTENFEQRTGEAMQLQEEVLAKLDQMHAAALAQEQEAARLAGERAALERQRQEQEAATKAQREVEEAHLRQEREAFEAEQARQREAAAAAAAEQRRKDEAAAAELRAQQEELARQQREFQQKQAAAAKAEQDRKDAEARAAREKAEAEAKAQREKEAAEHAERDRVERERLAEAARREAEQFAANGPGDVEIVRVLADHYDVTVGDVMGWLKKFDYEAADEQLAAENVSR